MSQAICTESTGKVVDSCLLEGRSYCVQRVANLQNRTTENTVYIRVATAIRGLCCPWLSRCWNFGGVR